MSANQEGGKMIDVSSVHARKQTLRRLLAGSLGLGLGAVVVNAFFGIPETYQMAVDLEYELMSEWRFALSAIVVLSILGLTVWAYYQLWNFHSVGLPVLAVLCFAPLALLNGTTVQGAFEGYVYDVSTLLTGMMLMLCWSYPDVFTGSPGRSSGGTETTGTVAGREKGEC